MKRLILGTCALALVVSALGQGQVNFNNRSVGTIVTKVYGPLATDITFSQAGNGTGDTPTGTVDWSAFTPLSGAGFTAQLWYAPGDNQPVSSLFAVTPTTTFRTGAAAGFINPLTLTLPGTTSGGSATLQLRVWDNFGGVFNDWSTAAFRGASPVFNMDNLGGGTITPPFLVGLVSFNLISDIPEPSTFALAGLAALTLLIFSRRK